MYLYILPNVRSIQFGFCLIFVFFLSLAFFLLFYRYFLWLAPTIHRITGKREGILIFLVFNFHPLMNIHIVLRDFYHFFLIDLFVITRLIADDTCSSLETCILFAYSLMHLSRSYWLWHFEVTSWGSELIPNYKPCFFKANVLANWVWHP